MGLEDWYVQIIDVIDVRHPTTREGHWVQLDRDLKLLRKYGLESYSRTVVLVNLRRADE